MRLFSSTFPSNDECSNFASKAAMSTSTAGWEKIRSNSIGRRKADVKGRYEIRLRNFVFRVRYALWFFTPL